MLSWTSESRISIAIKEHPLFWQELWIPCTVKREIISFTAEEPGRTDTSSQRVVVEGANGHTGIMALPQALDECQQNLLKIVLPVGENIEHVNITHRDIKNDVSQDGTPLR